MGGAETRKGEGPRTDSGRIVPAIATQLRPTVGLSVIRQATHSRRNEGCKHKRIRKIAKNTCTKITRVDIFSETPIKKGEVQPCEPRGNSDCATAPRDKLSIEPGQRDIRRGRRA